MTPLPKKKHTKGRSGRRRGGQVKTAIPNLSRCPKCKKLKQSHQACRYCGFYK
ncbi:50S ribosomal protein L32 [Patescibacteria group bacterium]